jgi:hypothetical protein
MPQLIIRMPDVSSDEMDMAHRIQSRRSAVAKAVQKLKELVELFRMEDIETQFPISVIQVNDDGATWAFYTNGAGWVEFSDE